MKKYADRPPTRQPRDWEILIAHLRDMHKRNELLQPALDASIAREAHRSLQDEALRVSALERLKRTADEICA